MTLQEAQQLIVLGCNVIYDGITYLRAEGIEIRYDRRNNRFLTALILMDRCLHSVTIAPIDKCTVVPL